MKTRFQELVHERLGESVTQEQIANKLGISQSSVSRWLKGKADRFDSETIASICKGLRCTPGDLFYIEYTDAEKKEIEAS